MTSKTRLPTIKCPHCGDRSIVRTSEQLTSTVRELRLVCTNDDCNASFLAQLSVIRMIRPSARPNPEVSIPLGRAIPANENTPPPANDDSPPAAFRTMNG